MREEGECEREGRKVKKCARLNWYCSGEQEVENTVQIPFEGPDLGHLFISAVFCWLRVISRDMNSLHFLVPYKG